MTHAPLLCRPISWRRPNSAFAPLAGEAHAHLLHGGARAPAGWSIIVADPVDVIDSEEYGDGAAWLRAVDAAHVARAAPGDKNSVAAPFCSGLVGFVGYEALAGAEPSLELPAPDYALSSAHFGIYDAAALFDRAALAAFVVGRSATACDQLEARLGAGERTAPAAPSFGAFSSNFSKADYVAAIAEIIEKIREGDFYQANISQRLFTRSAGRLSAHSVFQAIGKSSDAPFAALLQYAGGAIISNSPERFFKLERHRQLRRIVVEPIKGTRKRAADPEIDAMLARQLQEDPKERAENIMIVDLMRNDLSKICTDDSILEEAICTILSLTRVHHLVSRVSGSLRKDVRISDIFQALFPSGSITGAPKIEAMRAIAETEKMGRGPYCGTIGYIDDRGGADFSVAIRTLIADYASNSLYSPVGGGVTLRSDPSAEYEETLLKARGVVDILQADGERLK